MAPGPGMSNAVDSLCVGTEEPCKADKVIRSADDMAFLLKSVFEQKLSVRAVKTIGR